ncbi:MAG: hypothetical protein KJO98_14785, partial [Rhodothermia bacterium]|nr:hypothetical protein [Rhodothermia bacterium]
IHMALAAMLLLMAFLIHGRVPGLSADETAALGFLMFFGVGLPAMLIGIGTVVFSLLTEGRWLGVLTGALVLTTIMVLANVWTGLIASLSYLTLGVWALVQRVRDAKSLR